MAFSAQSSLVDLMAEPAGRDIGVAMADADQYDCLLSVHAAINNGDGTWTWQNITAAVRGLEWDRGAVDQLVQPTVGTAQVTVDNRNGYYSSWNTLVGPFAGSTESLLLPNTPMRFGVNIVDPVTSATKWLPLFSGRIEYAEETLVDNVDSYMVFHLVDVAASLAAHGNGTAMGGGPGASHEWVDSSPIVLPVNIVTAVNDQFELGTDMYTVAAGTYSTMAAVAAAMGAATMTGPVAFSTTIIVEAMGGSLRLSAVAPGTIGNVLHSGTDDCLTDFGFSDGDALSTYSDVYFGDTGNIMLPALLSDCDFGFGYIDNVTNVDPLAPTWTSAALQTPDRNANRNVAAQDIGTACNVMVYASSSGCIIAARFGPSIDGAADYGTFSNAPSGDPHNYPFVDAVVYSSTDRILNKVTGQRAQTSNTRILSFSYPGTLVDGTESPPFYPAANAYFNAVRVSRLASGAVDLLIDVNVNGSTITTVTLAAGDVTTTAPSTPIAAPVDEPITITVNTAGDAADVSVALIP